MDCDSTVGHVYNNFFMQTVKLWRPGTTPCYFGFITLAGYSPKSGHTVDNQQALLGKMNNENKATLGYQPTVFKNSPNNVFSFCVNSLLKITATLNLCST